MVHRLGSSTAHSKEHHSLSSRRSHPATAHITSQLLVSHEKMGILLLWGGGFARMALNLWASPECPYEWCFSHYFVISYFFQLCKCLTPSILPYMTVLPCLVPSYPLALPRRSSSRPPALPLPRSHSPFSLSPSVLVMAAVCSPPPTRGLLHAFRGATRRHRARWWPPSGAPVAAAPTPARASLLSIFLTLASMWWRNKPGDIATARIDGVK